SNFGAREFALLDLLDRRIGRPHVRGHDAQRETEKLANVEQEAGEIAAPITNGNTRQRQPPRRTMSTRQPLAGGRSPGGRTTLLRALIPNFYACVKRAHGPGPLVLDEATYRRCVLEPALDVLFALSTVPRAGPGRRARPGARHPLRRVRRARPRPARRLH